MTFSVPRGIEHQQGVFKQACIFESLEDVAPVVILDIASYQEWFGSVGCPDLGLAGVCDDTKDGGDDEDDQHDVTKKMPTQLYQGGPP